MAAKRKDDKGRILRKGERQREDGVYEYRYQVNGKRQSLYAATLEQLRRLEDQITVDRHDGIRANVSAVKLNDFFNIWCDTKRGLKDNTFQNYQYMYTQFVAPHLGDEKVVKIKKSDVRRFYNRLLEVEGLKMSTVSSLQTVLHQVLQLAVDDNYIRVNPADSALRELKLTHQFDGERKRALTVDEQKLLMSFVDESEQYRHWKPIITVMLGTGMRVGEVTGLRWKDIDLDKGTIDVNHTLVFYNKKHKQTYAINSTKTPCSNRVIPMLDSVREAFLEEKRNQESKGLYCTSIIDGYQDFIFCNRFGEVLNLGVINKALRRIIRDCNEQVLDNYEGDPIIIAAGIYLSSRIISYIAGELTESEREKQKKIDENIEKICSRYEEEPESDFEEEAEKSERIIEKKRELCDYLRTEAKARKEENETLHKEIKDTKTKVRDALRADNVVNTPLRKSSLEMLLRQLSEAQEKCYSYGQYLDVYYSELGLKTDSDEPPKFNMQLPSNYPHLGKVIWISSEQLAERRVELDVSGLFDVSVTVRDNDLFDVAEDSMFPIMVTEGHRKSYYGSLEKGAFKAYELANTHLGMLATVKEIQNNYVVLSYLDQLELFLPKDNLVNPYHFPPVRSQLMVYPVNWNYKLEKFKRIYPVTVSERRSDAISSLSFNNFPISFTEDEFSAFADFYKENLRDYKGEFLVGPVGTEDVILKKGALLKLQFGDLPLFYISIDEYEDRSDIFRYYFRFHGMCKPEEKTFSADDIFLPFDVTIAPYFDGTSVEMVQRCMEIEDMDDVSALIWDIFEEFRIQDQIRKNREGMGYFFKWESITNQLISELEQGDSINIKVQWLEGNSYNSIYADVMDPAELHQFIELFAQKTDAIISRNWKPQFLIKDEWDNRYSAFVIDTGRRLRIVGRNAYEVFYGKSDHIELYAVNYPYAEYQQKTALRQFRIGQVVNPVIQAACLSSKSVVSNFETRNEMVPFHNKDLTKNKSQKTAVELAFKEKNIFFIQGPPGTGKTTVIRELVEQLFDTDAESRVLIVSQANVAVDNALSGLVNKYGDETVRCGNGSKISQDFQKLILQRRCQDYIDDLIERKSNFDETFFSTWQDIVLANESNYYSPVLCELVIRNHRLIGATCVGLAKRNIGLERTEFDLVIIDEAGKALPAELLIPLVRAKKAVIIGDQCQLPPVINPILYDEERIDLEERAVSENELFRHSFFERLYNNAPDACKIMLDTQYRMPEVLGTAISKLFYDGKLKNGTGTAKREPVLFDSNITFVNFDGDSRYHEKKDGNKQITNLIEAKAAVSLVMSIRKKDPNCEIAVITPYKGQKRLISNSLLNAGIHYQIEKIAVDTVDSFQGSEADVVVFCTTRAVQPTLFFKDTRRLNVALSRAKRELIILGRMSYFFRYSRSESCLPSLGEYIQKNGDVIPSNQCDEVRAKVKANKVKDRLLSIDEISLPTAFYMEEQDNTSVDKKMDEFSEHGDFLNPLIVEYTKRGYILKEGFAQFRAAQELNIAECLCRIV